MARVQSVKTPDAIFSGAGAPGIKPGTHVGACPIQAHGDGLLLVQTDPW